MKKICSAFYCNRPAFGQGLCQRHYMAARRSGSLPHQPRTRRSPAHLIPGTSAYALWWKSQNPERYAQLKRESANRKNAARRLQPGYVSQQQISQLAADRKLRVKKAHAQGMTFPEIAVALGLSISIVTNDCAKMKLRGPGRRITSSANQRSFLQRSMATPKWVDQTALIAIYAEARRRNKAGESVEVDHIIPIKGKNISGLHVPWNLQIIPSGLNQLKRNTVENADLI
jgi:hypothetical protein